MPQPSSFPVYRAPKSGDDPAPALARVGHETGRSAPRIGIDLVRRMPGKQRLKREDYLFQGAFRGDADARAALVGAVPDQRLNRSLTAEGADDQSQLMADKYLSGLVSQANGFPVPKLKAVFATDVLFKATPTLRSAEDLARWLEAGDALPAFPKPVDGSMARRPMRTRCKPRQGKSGTGTA